jgi:hypothetical protein
VLLTGVQDSQSTIPEPAGQTYVEPSTSNRQSGSGEQADMSADNADDCVQDVSVIAHEFESPFEETTLSAVGEASTAADISLAAHFNASTPTHHRAAGKFNGLFSCVCL